MWGGPQGGPPGPRGSPWTRSSGFVDFFDKPTRASAADQGVRPTSLAKFSENQVTLSRKHALAYVKIESSPSRVSSNLSQVHQNCVSAYPLSF
jgi:hypothetical protein